MTTSVCILVGKLLQCIVSSSVPLAPAEAAKILEPGKFVNVVQAEPARPGEVPNSRPEEGPYGVFKPFPTRTRLDGSSYSDSPWMQVTWRGGQYRYGRRR